MDDLRILSSTPEYALAWAPSVVLCVWRARTTLEAARQTDAAMQCAREESGSGRCVLMTIVEARSPPPEARVRREMGEVLSRNGKSVSASALVFEGGGFQASTVRMVAAGLSLIARLPFPHHVFKSVGDAAVWLERASMGELDNVPAAKLEAKMAAVRHAPMISGQLRTNCR